MATNSQCGYSGSVSLANAEIIKWELSFEQDNPDASNMEGAGFKEYIPCLKSASGTFDSHTACGVIGSNLGVDFVNAIQTISADIIITNIKLTTDVAEKVVFSYTWVSTGEVTIS